MSLSTEDHLAIQQLYARYNHAIDFAKTDEWAATFTADGVFDGGQGEPQQGTDALKGFAQAFAERIKGRHWTNNLVIEGDGSGAKGSCYLILWNLGDQPPSILATGVYHDELVKDGGQWKFKSRKVARD